MPSIAAIHQHPIKGLPGRALDRAMIGPQGLAGDRRFAVRHPTRRERATPDGWVPKNKYQQQMFEVWLAALEPDFDASGTTVRLAGEAFDLTTDAGRDGLRGALAAAGDGSFAATDLQVIESPAVPIRERPDAMVSLAGLASVAALEADAGRPLGRARFRMNLWIDGLDAFAELDWAAPQPARLRIGAAVLEVWKRCDRCRQINASPGARRFDTDDLVRRLKQSRGHTDLGLLLRVVEPGEVAVGDRVSLDQ